MKKFILTFIFLIIAIPAFAKTDVITTYPYIKDITERIGKDKVNVSSLATGDWDPHFIIPRPSLISKSRKAQLIIINGAQLEIGWLPQIIRQANNPNIQTGTKGLLDLSTMIKLQQVPVGVSRAMGDVHPNGNPHFLLDPYNVPVISKAISERLSQLDPQNSSFYSTNNNEFTNEWNKKLKVWNAKLKPLSGTKVYEYHRLYDYFLNRYNFVLEGALEPLPGIPPTPKHLQDLIENAGKENIKFIFQDVYHPIAPANYIAGKTSIKVVTIPQDVNALKEATDIFALFDVIVDKLTK